MLSLKVNRGRRMPTEDRRKGLLAMASAVFMFSIMDATIKRLADVYGPFEMASIRCMASLAVLLPLLLWKGRLRELIPHQPAWHFARAVLGVLTLTTFVYAVGQLTLGSTYAIYLCAPLIVATVSATLMRHKVSGRQWTAIVIGLVGVLCILRPFTGHALSTRGVLAATISATAYSLNLLAVPKMTRRNSNSSLVLWFLFSVGAACGAIAAPTWYPVRPGDYPWLALIGVSGALGQYWITRALQLAPAFVVAPVEYTSIVWALAIDWLFWSRPLAATTLLGAGLILLSGSRLDVAAKSPRDEVPVS